MGALVVLRWRARAGWVVPVARKGIVQGLGRVGPGAARWGDGDSGHWQGELRTGVVRERADSGVHELAVVAVADGAAGAEWKMR